ncbi:hypothetical protein KAU37_00565 [Candidatus Bipolaricaulota bacterium]|nr:hypothetical protein [Candidatus Bipolaricaulota bacterium]
MPSQKDITPKTNVRIPLSIFVVMMVGVVSVTSTLTLYVGNLTRPDSDIGQRLGELEARLERIESKLDSLQSEQEDITKPSTSGTMSSSAKRAFSLGFDLHVFFGTVLAKLTTESEDTASIMSAATSARAMALQDARLMDIDLELSDPELFTSVDDLMKSMEQSHKEALAKIEATSQELRVPYLAGRWAGMVLISVSAGRHGSSEQAQELLERTLSFFDSDTFEQFAVSEEIGQSLDDIRRELVALRRAGRITTRDYEIVSEMVLSFTDLVLGTGSVDR